MDAETRKALHKAIVHWERMHDLGSASREAPTATACALCQKFLGISEVCKKCPVMEKTGFIRCLNTPYRRAVRMYQLYGIGSPEFKAAAQDEINFLKSLDE